MLPRSRNHYLYGIGMLLFALLMSGCTTRQASDCNLAEQMGAVFVQSLQFANPAMNLMATDAVGCNL